jgi:O-antigen/teichoic acid export membrane protein
MLIVSGTLAVFALGALALGTDVLFRDVPDALLRTARESVLVLGVGVAIAIIGIALQGYFFAIHRAIVPAMVTVVARSLTAAGLVLLVLTTKSVLDLAMVTLGGGLLSTVVIVALVRRHVGAPMLRPRLVRRSWMRELGKHSSTLIGWSLAMVAITGLDLVIVGAFDFKKVGGYGIAAQGVSLMLGLFGAAASPLTAAAARRHAEGDAEGVGRILLDFSRVSVTVLVFTSSLLFVAAPWLIEIYAGARYVAVGSATLRILLLGNVLRNTCAPLGSVLVATGEHRRVLLSPVVEGSVNLGLSLWWVHVFGAEGVAWATAVGAVFAVAIHVLRTLPRARAFRVSSGSFALNAVGRPALVALPALAMAGVASASGLHPMVATVVALVPCAAVAWFVSLQPEDRSTLLRLAGPIRRRLAR